MTFNRLKIGVIYPYHLTLLGIFLLSSGCNGCKNPDISTTVSRDPVPFEEKQHPTVVLPIQSVNERIPGSVKTYSVWRIEWEGHRAARVVLERFRRDDCYGRGSYSWDGDGELGLTELQAVAESSGDHIEHAGIILTTFLDELANSHKNWAYTRDVVGRIVWAYLEGSKDDPSSPGFDLMWHIDYKQDHCILPLVLLSTDVPAKQIPVKSSLESRSN